MKRRSGVRGTQGPIHAAVTLGWAIAVTISAAAQPWVPSAGHGSVSQVFQSVEHTGHLLDDGSELEGFDSESQGVLVQVDYAVTDRFSLSAAIPYIRARYLGPEPSFFGLEIDDCRCWNSGWQDFRLTARYNLFNGTFGLTPSVTYVVPSHSYQAIGEAVLGRNLWELQVAADAGRRLDFLSPALYVSGRYAYAFVEEVLGIGTDRSNASLSLGYQFGPRVTSTVDVYWQRTHGGLDSTEFVTDELFLQFDRLLKDNSTHVGASVSYAFARADVFLSFIDFVDGTDTHTGQAVTLGVSWPFRL